MQTGERSKQVSKIRELLGIPKRNFGAFFSVLTRTVPDRTWWDDAEGGSSTALEHIRQAVGDLDTASIVLAREQNRAKAALGYEKRAAQTAMRFGARSTSEAGFAGAKQIPTILGQLRATLWLVESVGGFAEARRLLDRLEEVEKGVSDAQVQGGQEASGEAPEAVGSTGAAPLLDRADHDVGRGR